MVIEHAPATPQEPRIGAPATGLPTGSATAQETRPATATAPRLRDRVLVRLRAGTLDGELARGTRPDASPPLALRAEVLLRPAMRHELANALRAIVGAARRPAGRVGRIPIRRRTVLELEYELQLLASRLDSPLPVQPGGVARVRILLSDGCGPLYHSDGRRQLAAVVREASAALQI